MVQLTPVLYKAYHGGHLTIRLALGGCTKWPFHHIVASPNKCPTDGHFMEQLGSYDPLSSSYGKKLIALNLDQIWHCIGCGAHLSKPVEKLLEVLLAAQKTDTEATETRELTSVNIAVGTRLKSS
ncbi:hypothetical protein FD755_019023 [Muntiacus reevesi]|uniref:Small ribosomal subunit protein bS16m n=2 Tax=Muntiacus TaxID=9885 RepID=A0A5N3X7A4_MUNRE|nr:hypothetical protein FD754_013457 [Muntiacus muntjak]KAB0369018.1 hypothetical protein FD755_019023 [Muntiacus reevesi]